MINTLSPEAQRDMRYILWAAHRLEHGKDDEAVAACDYREEPCFIGGLIATLVNGDTLHGAAAPVELQEWARGLYGGLGAPTRDLGAYLRWLESNWRLLDAARKAYREARQ